ncbi:hypothetical protein CGLAMM_11395 [Acetobacteraceae bacterium EV16G]
MSAAQQRQQLKTSWENYLGDAYASQKAYIDQATALDKTLAAERLNIQKQYADQAKQASLSAAQSLTTSFGSLTDYARSLATSDYSPLSFRTNIRSRMTMSRRIITPQWRGIRMRSSLPGRYGNHPAPL